MPYSYNTFNQDVISFVREHYPDKETWILDVGAGAGKYGKLLFDYSNKVAVESYAPYIDRFSLRSHYSKVLNEDVLTWGSEELRCFDLAILGDVLEHFTVEEAQTFLQKLSEADIDCLILVPYLYQQGADDNEKEEHIQSDLTHKLVTERYPGLTCVMRNVKQGVYFQGTVAVEEQTFTTLHYDLSKVRLCIATPVHNGVVALPYTQSLWKTQAAFAEAGIPVTFISTEGTMITKSRNCLVAEFMARDFTHLLFVDSDQSWGPEDILRLLHLDRPLIGVAVRRKSLDITVDNWAVNFFTDRASKIERGALECQGVGTGFLMIQRTVIEQMFDHYPETKLSIEKEYLDDGFINADSLDYYYALFDHQISPQGGYLGEDYVFCKRWTAIGGECWVDTEGEVGHHGMYEWRGSVQSLLKESE